jgi:hypothetical protein
LLKFSQQIYFAVKQNLNGIENKKVLITSKLKKNFKKFIEILFQIRIKFKAKHLSSQDKVSRSQQNQFCCLNTIVAVAVAVAALS